MHVQDVSFDLATMMDSVGRGDKRPVTWATVPTRLDVQKNISMNF